MLSAPSPWISRQILERFSSEATMTEQLARYEQQLKDLAAELASVGFMSQGSVVLRHTHCANPGCRCHGDPPALHGPYWQWSRAKDGKTNRHPITQHKRRLHVARDVNRST